MTSAHFVKFVDHKTQELSRINTTYSSSAVPSACCYFSWKRDLDLLSQLKRLMWLGYLLILTLD